MAGLLSFGCSWHYRLLFKTRWSIKNWYIHYLNLASVETIYQTKIDKSEKVQGPDHIIGIEKYTLFGNKELTIEATEKGITLTFDKKFTFFQIIITLAQ